MSINTYVAGEPVSIRTQTEGLRGLAAGAEDDATGWHRTRSESEADWEGQAAEAYRDFAGRNGRDADTFEQLLTDLARAEDVFADDLNTVLQRMEQAKQVAHEGRLIVMEPMIWPPKPPANPTVGGLETDIDTPAQEKAAAELYAQQQAAYAEAQQIVADARQLERTAHQQMGDALNTATEGLRGLGQREAWSQAAAHATSPAATDLAHAAAAMENHAAEATKAAFESSMKGGPAPVHGVWSSMSAAQRQDLIDRFPQMVGSTNGVPVAARDRANMARLDSQKQAVLQKIHSLDKKIEQHGGDRAYPVGQWAYEREQLQESLDELNKLDDVLKPDDKYLLGMDATANDRGQVIIASGNPDKADHVLTTVPGTFSDMGGASNYVGYNDDIAAQAEQAAPGQDVATVMWADYKSPPSLPGAAFPGYAEDASDDLAQFQQGLRVTHDGPPSHNTVMGHSYGSTVVGFSARDYGLHADEIMFIGSPGTGVEHASQFQVGADHVWAGLAGGDPIETWTPTIDADEFVTDWFNGEDHHRFGMDPTDSHYGGNVLPTDPNGNHSSYWKYDKTVDAMGHVVAGQAEGMKQ